MLEEYMKNQDIKEKIEKEIEVLGYYADNGIPIAERLRKIEDLLFDARMKG